MSATSGLVIVDKPPGWTSHDVVAKLRRLAGTRRVGHAGTLDPMATGVLVVGVEKATRMLGHLALTEKHYDATIRLGQTTNTDDADGEIIASVAASAVTAAEIRAAAKAFTGPIQQIPPQVSAVKIQGKRAYKRVRDGERVKLAARSVVVHEFDLGEPRPAAVGPATATGSAVIAESPMTTGLATATNSAAISEPAQSTQSIQLAGAVDVDAAVTCTSGTYIRALARDVGEALGVGGHLTHLRRTRVGPFDLSMARTIEQLSTSFEVISMAAAAAVAFPRREVTAEEARTIAHGGRLAAAGLGPGPIGVFGPDGELLALMEEDGTAAKPLAVFVAG